MIEFALHLESEFGVAIDQIAMDDLVTVTRVVARLLELRPDLGDTHPG